MKTLTHLLMIFIFSAVLSVGTLYARDSVSPTPSATPPQAAETIEATPQDLKEIRKIIAENQSLKDENSVLKQQATDYQAQSVQYNELYKQEKHRADVIQGNRIKNLESQLGERALQINALRQQANDDREYISRLEFDKQKLKGKVKTSFWKGFATGGTAGAAGGAVVGYKLGNKDPSFRLAGINF